MLMAFCDGHLVIPSTQIYCTEYRGSVEPIHKIINPRDRVLVYLCVGVQSSKIHTHPHGAILLFDEQQRVPIGTGALANPPLGQEFINLLFAFSQFKWAHTVEPVLWDRSIRIAQMDLKVYRPTWW